LAVTDGEPVVRRFGYLHKDRRAAQLPERPSSACSSSTLRGDLRTSAPGAYLPAVSASGTCAYRRAARAARRPDLMDKPSLQTPSSIMPVRVGQQRLRLSLGKLCPLFTFSTMASATWRPRRQRCAPGCFRRQTPRYRRLSGGRNHAARGSLWKRFNLTAKRASQIGGLVLEQHRGGYGHWRHGGSILLRQAGRHLDENRHCDSGTCAGLALLLDRQQHFDLYAHSARRAPLGQQVRGPAEQAREHPNRSCRAVRKK
jgi:hypothetical protein